MKSMWPPLDSHLFYDLFLQDRGDGPLSPPGSATDYYVNQKAAKELNNLKILRVSPNTSHLVSEHI